MQDGEPKVDAHDPKSANRRACVRQHQPLTSQSQRNPGKSSIRSSDGSTRLPRTSLLASQIFSRPWSDLTSPKKPRLHRPRATTPAGTRILVEAQDGRRRKHSRPRLSKRATLAHCLNRRSRRVRTLGIHHMDLMAPSAPA